MYCNYNVTTYPMRIVTTYPKVVFFTRNTCQSKTHAHKAVIIPSIYTTGIHVLHFPTLSISSCSWIFLVNFRKCKKNSRRGKNNFFGHNFLLLPNNMISKFRMQSWFEMFFIRYNREFLMSSSFEKTQL